MRALAFARDGHHNSVVALLQVQALALDGGAPVRNHPLAPWPVFDPDEIEAATTVLQSGNVNYWTGNEGRAFEREFATAVDVAHAIATSNGTTALEIALRGVGIRPGDHVIVPSRTFVATASAVASVGAQPRFADVELDSGNVTVDTLEAMRTPETTAVIVVHLGGWPVDMPAVMAWARAHDLKVIEDCAQAHGATIDGRPVGGWGDVAAFSFCQDKIMTTGGEGGMIVTNDDAVWRAAWSLKDHGKSWRAVYEQEHPPGFRWLHEQLGTNARLTEMQSAIGRRQLTKLGTWVDKRREHAQALAHAWADQPALRIPQPPTNVRHAAYRFYAYVRPDQLRDGWSRDRVMMAINAEGIPVSVGSCGEIYREKAFDNHPSWRPATRHPQARELFETSLAFLVHHTMSTDDVSDTIDAVHRVLAQATR